MKEKNETIVINIKAAKPHDNQAVEFIRLVRATSENYSVFALDVK